MTQAEQFRVEHDLEDYESWGVPFEKRTEGSGFNSTDYFSVDCTVNGIVFDCYGESTCSDYEWNVNITFPDGSEIHTGFTSY